MLIQQNVVLRDFLIIWWYIMVDEKIAKTLVLGRFWSKSRNRRFWHNFSESKSWKNRYLKKWKKSKSNLRIAMIKKAQNRTNCGHIFDLTKTFCNFVAILHWLMALFYNFWPVSGHFEKFWKILCLFFFHFKKD